MIKLKLVFNIIKYNFYTVCRRNRRLEKGGRVDVGVEHCLGNFGPSKPGLSDQPSHQKPLDGG